MKFQNKTLAILGLVLVALAIPAKAGFVGDTASVNYEWPNLGTVLYPGGSSVIAPGGTIFSAGASVDVSNTNILVTFPNGWLFNTVTPKTFDGLVITDPTANITGVSLASTNIPSYTASQISFDSHDVFINFLGLSSLTPGASVSVNVQFASTPEPSSFALLFSGLLGIGLLSRRRHSDLN